MYSRSTSVTSGPVTVVRQPRPERLDPEKWLYAKGIPVRARRDEMLFSEGEDARSCYKVTSGAVRVMKVLADGRRYVVDFLLPGDFVGFNSTSTYEFTAEAIVDSELVRFPRARIEAEINENPVTGRRMLELAMQRLAVAHDQMMLLGRMSAMERIATFLLTLRRRLDTPAAGSCVISLAMTRMDIADHLGLTLETVSRMLNRLKRLAIIDLPHPQRICILDVGKLKGLANSDHH